MRQGIHQVGDRTREPDGIGIEQFEGDGLEMRSEGVPHLRDAFDFIQDGLQCHGSPQGGISTTPPAKRDLLSQL